ncbi:MAG: S-methyl-5-thioribose-1-phosphate isomerase, partial [Chloroflexi bacterium]|nr:S-methyl-5-thioribose-1-phosphate isomerase [Chloroflexota bacterium]
MKTVEWAGDRVRLIDQTRLPWEFVVLDCTDHRQVASAIREMRVRGAPAIGVAAALAVALAARRSAAANRAALLADLADAAEELRLTRPTAVNLFWAIERMKRVIQSAGQDDDNIDPLKAALLAEAEAIATEDEDCCQRIGAHGASVVPQGARILTHCNAGALATVDYGTALGVIRAAHAQGKVAHVYVDETRPLLQGARLTAWELDQAGIPFTLITDNMAGHFLHRGAIDLAVVGSDRIAANGDVANKIGTYSVAVLCKENGVPFYAAAPTSTVDLSLASGEDIPIEERSPAEVTHLAGKRIAPEGIRAANPAFDVTPHRYVTAIITENGVVHPPFGEGLQRVVGAGGRR